MDSISQEDIDLLLKQTVAPDSASPESNPAAPPGMDDPQETGKEGESFAVSQDDIDMLFEMASENAGTARSQAATPSAGNQTDAGREKKQHAKDLPDDDSGLVTQDDIDALLESSMEGEAFLSSPPGDEAENPAEAVNGTVSQDDIDALMQDIQADPDAPQPEPDPEAQADPPEETVSQDDIDALMQDIQADPDAPQPEPDPEAQADPPEETVSQDDIDALMQDIQADPDAPQPEPDPEAQADPPEETVSQDDIDALMQDIQADPDAPQPEPEARAPKQAEPLEGKTEKIAAGAKEHKIPQYVDQEDIDLLLREAAVTDGEPSVPETAPATAKDQGAEEKSEEFISQDDIDLLLQAVESEIEDLDGEDSAPAADDSNLITQDDIDLLLKGTSEEFEALAEDDLEAPLEETVAETDKEFISQDEINRLLSVGEGEIPGDSAQAETVPQPGPVILEQVEEESTPASRMDSPPEKSTASGFLSGRRLWAGVAACAVFLLAVGVFYFSRGMRSQTRPVVQTYAIAVPDRPQIPPEKPVPAVIVFELPGFVVPAPPANPKATYMAADIFITLTGSETEARIKAREPFCRKVIYEVLREAMTAPDLFDAREDHLQQRLKAALEKALPQTFITQVKLKHVVIT